uniref:Uncharacterized protein n=1 Tax=uncultured marine virus TaxID=186617 RepID=A0A0F7L7D1_9VIRU|nr:hypothetical protein [uncultured marine virus]
MDHFNLPVALSMPAIRPRSSISLLNLGYSGRYTLVTARTGQRRPSFTWSLSPSMAKVRSLGL